MKIYLIIILCISSFGSNYSQNSFYIVPTISGKFGISSTDPFFSQSNKNPQNEYFNVYNKQIHNNKSIFLGLGLGWKNEKQRFSIDVTWNQDASSISNETVLLRTNGDKNYYSNQNLIRKAGFVSSRFSLNLNKSVYKDLIDLTFGMGFTYLPQGDENYQHSVNYGVFAYDSTTTMMMRNTITAVAKNSLNLSLGLTFKLKWNDLYLFSLSTLYSHGFRRNLMVSENYYEITNLVTNETIQYSYASASKGSGLFIQFSRKFQLYPRRPKKKK